MAIPLLVGALLLGVAPPAFASPTASPRLTAARAPADVSVLIETLTPLSPGPKDTLRIAGRVLDRSLTGLTAVQVSLHMGTALTSRAELHALRESPVPQPLAWYFPTLGNGELTPGRALRFSLSLKISDLQGRGLLSAAGVYPMQVTATGIRPGDGRPSDLATASTFLPYLPATAAKPATPVAWLIPLTADPALLADGDLTTNALTSEIAKGGRLQRLLDALQSATSASVTLDPALIRTLSLAANGHYVVAVPGKTTGQLQPANSAAKDWLSELRASSHLSVIPLPYDDVDVEALVHNRGSSLADAAFKRGDDVLKLGLLHTTTSVTSGIAVPPDGLVDAAGAKYYRTAAKADALVLSADAVPSTGDNPSAAATSPSTPTRLLLSDAVLNGLVKAGVPAGTTPRLAEQEIIAELAEAHTEDGFTTAASKTAAAARPLLIAAPDGWNPTTAWLSRLLVDTAHLPWIRQTSVASLLDSPTEPRAGLQYPDAARGAELPSVLVQSSLAITASTHGLFSSPQPAGAPEPQSPDSILQPIRDAALAAVSSRWRSDPAGAFPFRNSAEVALTSLAQQVKVVASPQVTLTSRSGKVPVTLENDLGAAVDVSLVLSSLDRSRVSSDTVVTRNIRAGQKVQVEVEVKAASAGTFPVRLTLYTSDGRPLGTPVQVLVRSTRYGVVATIFTIVALSLLGLAVLFRAVRGLIRRSRRPGQSPPVPSSSPASNP